MRIFAAAGATLLATTALAQAGGIERTAFTTGILFEEGTYVELGYTFVDPSISGVQSIPAGAGSPAGSASGDIAPSYGSISGALRTDITPNLSFALIYDEPIGADVNYAARTPPGYLYGLGTGSEAEINSQQITAVLRYEFDSGFSVYGGGRYVMADGNVSLFNGYRMTAQGSDEFGYMVGAAYERPDIALRVALTYFSATDHTFTTQERLVTAAGTTGPFNTSFQTTIPQSVLLEAQTGVAEGTLVFGSVRWTDWSEFDITPDLFSDGAPNGSFGPNSLVDYDNDSWTYTLGGARVLTENWTVLGSVSYEASQGGFSGNLGPTDGRTSLGIGVRYSQGPMRITAGLNYSWIGNAVTEAPSALGAPAGTQFASFQDNTAIGAGIRIGFQF